MNARHKSPELTEKQLVVLEVAVEIGYFDVPRRANLDDVARVIGISHQSASERLRRAQRTLFVDIFEGET